MLSWCGRGSRSARVSLRLVTMLLWCLTFICHCYSRTSRCACGLGKSEQCPHFRKEAKAVVRHRIVINQRRHHRAAMTRTLNDVVHLDSRIQSYANDSARENHSNSHLSFPLYMKLFNTCLLQTFALLLASLLARHRIMKCPIHLPLRQNLIVLI